MADSFHLHVVTPDGAALETEVLSLTIASKHGEITVLPGHCLLLAALEAGRMVAEGPDKSTETFAVAGGYLEGGPNHVNVICDRCLPKTEIDPAAIAPRIGELEQQITDLAPDAPERTVAAEELHWLRACTDVAEG